MSLKKYYAWKNIVRKNANGDLVGPGVLYETPDGEIITMDSESLSFFQRAALEVQYIVDGSDKLNPNIANSIYEWTNNFLFPDAENSMSPSQADCHKSFSNFKLTKLSTINSISIII